MNISFHSYKGGTGKTISSTNMASILGQKYKILLVEADIKGPTYGYNFNVDHECFIDDILSGSSSIEDAIITGTDNTFDLIISNPNLDGKEHLISNVRKNFANTAQLWKEFSLKEKYDIIIFDLSPSIDVVNSILASITDIFYLFLRYDATDVIQTSQLINKFYGASGLLNSKNFHIVFNQVPTIVEFQDDINDKLASWQTTILKDLEYTGKHIHFHTLHSEMYIKYLKGNEVHIFPDDTQYISNLKEMVKNFYSLYFK